MNSLISPQNKSRLAGFFLCILLCGCEQPSPSVVPGELLFQKAQQAEANGLLIQASAQYEQSAAQGYLPAIAARLALQKPTDSSQQLREWLATLPNQGQLFAYYQQLGAQLENSEHQTFQYPQQQAVVPAKFQQQAACAISIQPIVSAELEGRQWQGLMQAWQEDAFLQTLPVCFHPTLRVSAERLACSDEPNRRLQCDFSPLESLVRAGSFSQIVLITGRGTANYNNGVLLLPTYADLALLRHEFSHIVGMMDEYAFPTGVAKDECQKGRIVTNLLFDKADLPAYLRKWQLTEQQINLTPVATCEHAKMQAYRVVSEDTHMTYFELAIPKLYQYLIQQQLKQPAEIMPVQYYFAYLARQKGDWQLWQQFMQIAADYGYQPAQSSLQEWQQRQVSE